MAGDPFEPELAAAAAAISEGAAIDAVDELQQLDLIRASDVPRRFRFRHPLVRRAVYEATASGWRLGAHERCAEVLAARGMAAAGRAHHVERSARQGDLAAIDVLREAGGQQHGLRPGALRVGWVRPCGYFQRPRQRRIASSFCSPVPRLCRPRATSPIVMKRCWRRSRSSRSSRVPSARRSRRHAQGWSVSSGDTRTPTPAWWGPFAACRTRPPSSPSSC